MGNLPNFHLPSALSLGSEQAGVVRTLKRRIVSALVLLIVAASLLLLAPERLRRRPAFATSKFFRSPHSVGPVLIRPVQIPYNPSLFGLDAPVEWYSNSLASAVPWTNPIRWPILLTSSRLLKEAEPLPLHVFPRVIKLPSHAPNPSDLIFGMATTAQRASVLSELWPVWLGAKDEEGEEGPIAVVVLPQEDHEGGDESAATNLSNKLKKDRGLNNVLLTTSWLGQSARYEMRYFGMLRDMEDAAHKAGRQPLWYIVSDDDTLWTDERMLRRALSNHDPNQSWLLGSSSEGISQINQFGNMAFGGAGIIISRGLCKEMLKIHADCVEQSKNVFGGDEMYSLCAARAAGNGKTKETVVTQLTSLHQLDLPGDGTGFFQSGFPFLSLHHLWHGWTDAFAREHQTSFQGPDNALNHLLLLQQAAQILGGDNFMRRGVYNDGREMVTLGYTVVRFDVPLRREDFRSIEKTWSGDSDYPLRFPTRPRIIETDQVGTGGKRTYYLSEIRASKSNPKAFSFIHRDRWGEYAVITWRED